MSIKLGQEDGNGDGENARYFIRTEHRLFGIMGAQELDREFFPNRHREGTNNG